MARYTIGARSPEPSNIAVGGFWQSKRLKDQVFRNLEPLVQPIRHSFAAHINDQRAVEQHTSIEHRVTKSVKAIGDGFEFHRAEESDARVSKLCQFLSHGKTAVVVADFYGRYFQVM
jgi:hypothetical protein